LAVVQGYEDDEEPLVLLDQVVEEDQFEEMALSASVVYQETLANEGDGAALPVAANGHALASGAGGERHWDDSYEPPSSQEPDEEQYFDDGYYGPGASLARMEADCEERAAVQYPLEPWPANFQGTEDQPVEFQLATMEARIFRKMQSRSYLVPQGGNQINWDALKRIRLKGM
jgi:hypothetical protein